MLAIALLVLGVASRLIIHFTTEGYNFNPVIAIALFGGFYLKNQKAIFLPLALFAISDVIIGFHETMVFTWGSILLIAWVGIASREKKSVLTVATTSLVSAIIFFLITNFGVWLASGMYPMTWSGLLECFIAAIPFFRPTIFSTLIYAGILFGAYELVAARVKNTRFAHVL